MTIIGLLITLCNKGGKMSKVDETFLAAFKERVAAQEISRFWHLELEEVGPGRAKVSMVCRPEMANILGMVHGSAIFALIDEAFQAAVNGHGTVAVALNMNLTFHAAAKMGERLTALTRELHAGRRTATYFIEVTGPQGRLIASCQALAYRKDMPLEFAGT
jgi:acyl-CoA thioesterase